VGRWTSAEAENHVDTCPNAAGSNYFKGERQRADYASSTCWRSAGSVSRRTRAPRSRSSRHPPERGVEEVERSANLGEPPFVVTVSFSSVCFGVARSALASTSRTQAIFECRRTSYRGRSIIVIAEKLSSPAVGADQRQNSVVESVMSASRIFARQDPVARGTALRKKAQGDGAGGGAENL